MIHLAPAVAKPLRDLGSILRGQLSGETATHVAIDPALADFAIRRHKCGPLLHLAVKAGANADGEASAMLSADWQGNRRAYLRNHVTADRIATALEPDQIPALALKGASVAALLYPDPLWRHSGDLDLFVPARLMPEALHALGTLGLIGDAPVLALSSGMQRTLFRFIRDVSVDDGWTDAHVEVHGRPLLSGRLSRFLTRNDSSLTPRPVPKEGVLPRPALDTGFGLYLLWHGCVSGWSRLKWLVDLIPLLERSGPAGREALAQAAEQSRTSAAVKASLALLESVFGAIDLAPLDRWMAQGRDSAAVQARLRAYTSWIDGPEAAIPMGTSRAMTHALLMLNDRRADQLALLSDAAGSRLAREFARRMA
ncbi:MAG: nucleotidyltransferase family protein [Sphingomonas sp.]